MTTDITEKGLSKAERGDHEGGSVHQPVIHETVGEAARPEIPNAQRPDGSTPDHGTADHVETVNESRMASGS